MIAQKPITYSSMKELTSAFSELNTCIYNKFFSFHFAETYNVSVGERAHQRILGT